MYTILFYKNRFKDTVPARIPYSSEWAARYIAHEMMFHYPLCRIQIVDDETKNIITIEK